MQRRAIPQARYYMVHFTCVYCVLKSAGYLHTPKAVIDQVFSKKPHRVEAVYPMLKNGIDYTQ
jgi:hypothetical protein